jgi:hypothetical protein
LAQNAKERWIQWHTDLVSNIRDWWLDIHPFQQLDEEEEAIWAALNLMSKEGRYDGFMRFASLCSDYYYIRGQWDKRAKLDQMWIEASIASHNTDRQARATASHVEMLVKQGLLHEADHYLPILNESREADQLKASTLNKVHHALALYWLSMKDVAKAEALWRASSEKLSLHLGAQLTNRLWLAECLRNQSKFIDARQQLLSVLNDAQEHQRQSVRHITSAEVRLATIYINEGNLETAEHLLYDARDKAQQDLDRRRLAQVEWQFYRLHRKRNDQPAARAALMKAIDLHERMGMREELTEARNELSQMEAQIVS